MISACISNKLQIKNYLNLDHPYQKEIRKSLEHFTKSKILKKNYATDGCSAPQYAFALKNLAISMINILHHLNKEINFKYLLIKYQAQVINF